MKDNHKTTTITLYIDITRSDYHDKSLDEDDDDPLWNGIVGVLNGNLMKKNPIITHNTPPTTKAVHSREGILFIRIFYDVSGFFH